MPKFKVSIHLEKFETIVEADNALIAQSVGGEIYLDYLEVQNPDTYITAVQL